eukprot:Gregarina_sp_Poly_1__3317@NODE_1954_length_3005_cov_33_233152_g396_i1_p1_GENE_NODE_1954_length_3005_cov_33_233152_g396_i1NODE_1954_length_3005_cov_33_233152_g396_i1_p1_ORF_typecomplete_len324_score34_78_NODE_1954_length_3005_cov_33_233152_g396_i16631634
MVNLRPVLENYPKTTQRHVEWLKEFSIKGSIDDIYLVDHFTIYTYYGKEMIEYAVCMNNRLDMKRVANKFHDFIPKENKELLKFHDDAVNHQDVYIFRVLTSFDDVVNFHFLSKPMKKQIRAERLLTVECLTFDVCLGIVDDKSDRRLGNGDLENGILRPAHEDPNTAIARHPEIVLRAMHLKMEFPHLKFEREFATTIKREFAKTRALWRERKMKLFIHCMSTLLTGRCAAQCVLLAQQLGVRVALDMSMLDVLNIYERNDTRVPLWIHAWIAESSNANSYSNPKPVYQPPLIQRRFDPLHGYTQPAWMDLRTEFSVECRFH